MLVWTSTFATNTEQTQDDGPPKHNYYKGKYQEMKESMQQVDWDNELDSLEDIDSVAKRIEDIIMANVKTFVQQANMANRPHGLTESL